MNAKRNTSFYAFTKDKLIFVKALFRYYFINLNKIKKVKSNYLRDNVLNLEKCRIVYGGNSNEESFNGAEGGRGWRVIILTTDDND